MITFDDFVTKWNGKPVDFDGIYPNQCMDLMHQYVYDVLGLTDKTILAAPAAYQAYTNNFPKYFTKIDNTPTGIPQKGDIIFWGQAVGPFGHVAIVKDANMNTLNSFDANWPTGTLPHIQSHNYNGCLGWLRPIPQVVDTLDSLRKQRDDNWNLYQSTLTTVNTQKTQIEALKSQISTAQTASDKEIARLGQLTVDLQTKLSKIKEIAS